MNTPRSFLFSPGNSRRKIEKGAVSAAHALVLDLEDGVALSAKPEARAVIRQAAQELDFGDKLCLVRLNGVKSALLNDDLAALAGAGLDGYILPKVESAAEIQQLHQLLNEAGEPDAIIYALLESALGVIHAPEIAAFPTLRGLMFGGEDFVASIKGKATAERSEILYARSALVTAARAYQLEAIDTIYIDYDDLEGLSREAKFARTLGFSGKFCIHPQQVELVNSGFQPSAAEIATAQAIVSAYEEHFKHGIGVFSFEGRMIDEAVVQQMRQLL
ncbi:MAG: CoA ester lyase [Ardenticatenaceae bacterium]|nr:CoA ester lyase [Ardenticatenaceae bacterium]